MHMESKEVTIYIEHCIWTVRGNNLLRTLYIELEVTITFEHFTDFLYILK